KASRDFTRLLGPPSGLKGLLHTLNATVILTKLYRMMKELPRMMDFDLSRRLGALLRAYALDLPHGRLALASHHDVVVHMDGQQDSQQQLMVVNHHWTTIQQWLTVAVNGGQQWSTAAVNGGQR
ncbi:hypothetical protein Tco_1076476, partial [Tanacetum coccineum]